MFKNMLCASGGTTVNFSFDFLIKNFETFDFSWFQKNILKFFDRQVRLTDSLSWTWQRSGSKISVENLGRKYTYNKKIIKYLIWTYSRIPAGYHDFSPWFFLTDVFFNRSTSDTKYIYMYVGWSSTYEYFLTIPDAARSRQLRLNIK